jgi:lipopolysaccharide transport system ATP-binding protein
MYVRLAFAVAAHLEPEILIVDEVLAVGDAEFQKKCLGKMKDVSVNDGRTVLFVSHNMAAVKQLCTTGIVMRNGSIVFDGQALPAVDFYQTSHDTNSFFEHAGPLDSAPGNVNIRILKFEVRPLTGEVIAISSGLEFELSFYNYKENINLDATFELRNLDEVVVFHHGSLITTEKDAKRGIYTIKGRLEPNLLNAGNYSFKIIFGENQRYALFVVEDFIRFEVMNEADGSNSNVLPGVIRPNIEYQHSFQNYY